MNLENKNIGHYARVPSHIITAKISARAKNLWTILALYSTPENPEVWIRLGSIADQLDCSIDSVSRALTELIKSNLLIKTPRCYQGRYKIYVLVWEQPQACETTLRTDCAPADLPAAALQVHVPQRCGDINKIKTNYEQIIFSKQIANPEQEAAQIMADYGPKWSQMFCCLDGLSGRPTLQECVEQALNHTARHKCANLRIYVETWLRNASKAWVKAYFHELTAPPTDPSLSPDAVARKLKAEQDRREKLEQKRRALEPAVEPFSEKLDWDLAFQQIRAPRSKSIRDRQLECASLN